MLVKMKSRLINPILTVIAACQNSSYKNWQKFNNVSAMLVISKEKDNFFILLKTPEKSWNRQREGGKKIWQIISNLTRIKRCSINNTVSWISANTSEDVTHKSNFTDLLKKRNRASSKQNLSFLKEKVYVTAESVHSTEKHFLEDLKTSFLYLAFLFKNCTIFLKFYSTMIQNDSDSNWLSHRLLSIWGYKNGSFP